MALPGHDTTWGMEAPHQGKDTKGSGAQIHLCFTLISAGWVQGTGLPLAAQSLLEGLGKHEVAPSCPLQGVVLPKGRALLAVKDCGRAAHPQGNLKQLPKTDRDGNVTCPP